MGNLTSSRRIGRLGRKSHNIDRVIAQGRKELQTTHRLLLLGTGESGKTTLFKQMSLLYGKMTKARTNLALPTEPRQREAVLHSIKVDIMTNLKNLFASAATGRYNSIKDKSLRPENNALLDEFLKTEFNAGQVNKEKEEVLNPKYISLIQALWKDEGVQQTWQENRHLLQVQEALPYFMEKLSKIVSHDYVPTEEDWLRVRVRTSGVATSVFQMGKSFFEVIDVGGQRSERRKWLPLFNEVTAVLYVVAISEYDQFLFEDESKNRVEESLTLCKTTINGRAMNKVPWIIFLNKADIYRQKLNKNPIRVDEATEHESARFTDFEGPFCPIGEEVGTDVFEKAHDAGIAYFKKKFNECSDRENKIKVFHTTCAMDQKNVDSVFKEVTNFVTTLALQARLAV